MFAAKKDIEDLVQKYKTRTYDEDIAHIREKYTSKLAC